MHSDGIVDELSAKHSHLSSQSQFESESGDGDFDSIFSSQIFSMVLKWVAQASTFTVQPGVRSSRTRLAQRLALPLAPHFAQDIVISQPKFSWKVQGSSESELQIHTILFLKSMSVRVGSDPQRG